MKKEDNLRQSLKFQIMRARNGGGPRGRNPPLSFRLKDVTVNGFISVISGERESDYKCEHMFDFSNTCVVKSTYYIGTICVAFTTQVCFIAHKCGNNQTCVGKPTQAGIGFFPHMFGKTHT